MNFNIEKNKKFNSILYTPNGRKFIKYCNKRYYLDDFTEIPKNNTINRMTTEYERMQKISRNEIIILKYIDTMTVRIALCTL